MPVFLRPGGTQRAYLLLWSPHKMGIPVIPGKQVEAQVPMGDADPNQTFKCCNKPSQLWPGRDRGHPMGGCDLTWPCL